MTYSTGSTVPTGVAAGAWIAHGEPSSPTSAPGTRITLIVFAIPLGLAQPGCPGTGLEQGPGLDPQRAADRGERRNGEAGRRDHARHPLEPLARERDRDDPAAADADLPAVGLGGLHPDRQDLTWGDPVVLRGRVPQYLRDRAVGVRRGPGWRRPRTTISTRGRLGSLCSAGQASHEDVQTELEAFVHVAGREIRQDRERVRESIRWQRPEVLADHLDNPLRRQVLARR